MRMFKATAYNEKEETFSFVFYSGGWMKIEETARFALDKQTSQDQMLLRDGPWGIRGIDVA